jgi:hypothetical protein
MTSILMSIPVVHARRKRRRYVNSLILGSNPSGPTR